MIPLKDSVPTEKFPFINYSIITANIVVFIFETDLAPKGHLETLIFSYGVVPMNILHDFSSYWTTLITSQFLHGGWMHIIGNMLYLYIFGDNVEDRLGHFSYLVFYIVCGATAALVQVHFNSESTLPMIGASGAIAGILGAYFLYYPKARILTLIPLGFFSRVVEIPAFFFLGFWFILQTFSGTTALHVSRSMGRDIGGVAWWAHAGGFIAGALMALLSLLFEK